MPQYLIIVLLSLSAIACITNNKKHNSKPNVIIIFTDDQGYEDVGCYGSPDIITPHLDKMAENGIMLTDFYAAQAVCSASRAGLLTGCYPNRLGIHGAFMPNSKKGLHLDEVTIAEMLKEQDYHTAHYGKWHLGDHPDYMPNQHGFDDFFGILYSNDMWPYHPQQGPIFNFDILELYENKKVIDTLQDQSLLTTQITTKSVQFIEDHKDDPFFLYIAHPQPHVPLFVSDKFKGQSKRGLYGDVIMEIDWSVGQVMEALEKHNLIENTIVIFASDNGPWLSYGDHSGRAHPLREGKGTALEGGQRVPCIIQYPGTIMPNRKVSTPMMNIDILPTIAHLTHSNLPNKPIDGKNVWTIWTGESDISPHEAYYYYYHVNELHGVRYKNWKMYFPHRYRTLNNRHGGEKGIPVKYEYNDMTSIELYNLEEDISETNNVAAIHPDVITEVSALANQMRQKLGDNLYNINGSENRQVGNIKKGASK